MKELDIKIILIKKSIDKIVKVKAIKILLISKIILFLMIIIRSKSINHNNNK